MVPGPFFRAGDLRGGCSRRLSADHFDWRRDLSAVTRPSASCIKKSCAEKTIAGVMRPPVIAIGLEYARLRRVGQVGGKDFVLEPCAELRVFDRKEDLAALEEVARHPVRAAAVDVLFAAVREVEDAAVFQEPAHDAADADVLAETLDAGPQRADAAHHQIDLHAGLRRLVERLDDALFEQRVHLGDNARRAALARVVGFALGSAGCSCSARVSGATSSGE